MGSTAGQVALGAGLVAAGIAATAMGQPWGMTLVSAGIGIGLGAAAAALAPTPESAKPGAVNRTVRSASATEQVIYGRARVGGAIVAIDRHTVQKSGPDADYLDLIVVVSARPIEGFQAIYLGDDYVPLEPNPGGNAGDPFVPVGMLIPIAGSKYRRFLGVEFYDGTQVTASQFMINRRDDDGPGRAPSIVWTTDHKLAGYAYAVVTMRYKQDVYASGIPNLSFDVKGIPVYDPRTGLTEWSENTALCAADYLASEYGPAGVTYADINEPALIAAANICDEIVEGSVSIYQDDFISDTSGEWQLGQDATNGTKTVASGSLVYTVGAGDGQRPRLVRPVTVTPGQPHRIRMDQIKGTAPTRECWVSSSSTGGFAEALTPISTNNQPLDRTIVPTASPIYLVMRAGTGSAAGNTVTLGAASVDRVLQGLAESEPRYRVSAAINAEEDWRQVAPKLALAMAGGIFRVGAGWFIVAGAPVAPTAQLGPDDMVDELDVLPRRSRRDLFNRVQVLARNEADMYQVWDSPPLQPNRYLLQDNQTILVNAIDMTPVVASPGQAIRIASIELEQNRQQITATGRFKWRALTVEVGDVVEITSERMGWTDKPFRVVRWELDLEEGVRLGLAEYCDAIYAYPPDDALGDCAPDTGLLLPPAEFNVTNVLVARQDAGDSTITWTAPLSPDVAGYEARWKPIGEVPGDGWAFGNGTWIALELDSMPDWEDDEVDAATFEIDADMDPVLVYRVEVRSIIAGGLFGDWVGTNSFPKPDGTP